ncbi:hypothetical protein QR680_009042 [Steinernema hermaphroditum]|uniref:Chromo domain-containing protein n=1 Tax=Steinernema hermaphroditum TaxID=289476 RepID=A0AA39M964_9BILA|nr:hypothetical protein QR680_009042 [Steinernema hermaphroditum]
MDEQEKSLPAESSDVSSVETSDEEGSPVKNKSKPSRRVADPNLEEEDEEDEDVEGEEAENGDKDASDVRNGDEELYEIERIVAHKKQRDNKILYKIRWKGYDASQDSWEPESSLIEQGCDDVIEFYWEEKHDRDEKEAEEREKEAKEAEAFYRKRQDESKSWGGILDTVTGDKVDEATKKEIMNLYVSDRVMTETEKALLAVNSIDSPATSVRLTRGQLRALQEGREKSTASSASSGSSKKRGSIARDRIPSKSVKRALAKMAGRKRSGLGDTNLDTDFITAEDSSSDECEPGRKKQKKSSSSSDSESDTSESSRARKVVKNRYSSKKHNDPEEIKRLKIRAQESREKEMIADLKLASMKAMGQVEERKKNIAASVKQVAVTKPRTLATQKVVAGSSGAITKPPNKNCMIPKKRPVLVKKDPVKLNISRVSTVNNAAESLLDSILNQQTVTVGSSAGSSSAKPSTSRSAPRKPSASVSLPDPEQLRITSIRERTGKRVSRDQPSEEVPAPQSRRRLEHQLPSSVKDVDVNELFKTKEEEYSKQGDFVLGQNQFVGAIKAKDIESVVKALRNPKNKFNLDYENDGGDKLLHMLVNQPCSSKHECDTLIRILADNGADLSARNANGLTPLMLAVKMNKLCNLRRLIGAGSPINATDRRNRNTLDMAIDHKVDEDIVKELLCAGANVSQRCRTKLKAKECEMKRKVVAELYSHLNLLKRLSEKRQDVLRDVKVINASVSPMFMTSLCDPMENSYTFDVTDETLGDSEGFLVTCMLVDTAPVFDAINKDNVSYLARFWGWSPVDQIMMNGENCEPLTNAGRHHFLFATNLLRRNILNVRLKEEYRRRPLFVVTQVIKIEVPSGKINVPENIEDEDCVDMCASSSAM